MWSSDPRNAAPRSSTPASPCSPSMPPRLITSSTAFSDATPSELPVLRDALKPHQIHPDRRSSGPCWSQRSRAMPSLLPAASALAIYDPQSNPSWDAVGGKVAQGTGLGQSRLSRPWLEALRPVRGKLTAPLAAIFRDKSRPETRTCAGDQHPRRLRQRRPEPARRTCSWTPTPRRMLSLLPHRREAGRHRPCRCSRPRLPRKPRTRGTIRRSIHPGRSQTPPSPSQIESAQGMLAERFAFCQTMPLDEFLTTAEALRHSGYRPIRFRPYADGQDRPGGGGLDP